MNTNASATLTGGEVSNIRSFQVATIPHIEMLVRNYEYNQITNVLAGTWEDFSAFSIQLHDQAPWDPAIENIKFTIIPEPATLCLLGLGAFWLKRRRRIPA